MTARALVRPAPCPHSAVPARVRACPRTLARPALVCLTRAPFPRVRARAARRVLPSPERRGCVCSRSRARRSLACVLARRVACCHRLRGVAVSARASCLRVPHARAVPSRACSRRVACRHHLRGAAVSARASCPRVPHARAVPSRARSVLRKKLVVLMKSAAVLPAGDPKLGLFHARRPSRAACALRAPRASPSCPAFSSAVSCCRIPSVPGPSVRPWSCSRRRVLCLLSHPCPRRRLSFL